MLIYCKVKKVKVSVYLKGGKRAATSYYRFCQFFDKMKGSFIYRLMIPDAKWKAYFPIAKQPFFKKLYIFFFIYFRVLSHLVADVSSPPHVLIISRCIINRVFPFSYRILLKILNKKGVKIIYDFDDDVLCSHEMSKNCFYFITCIADNIIVGSPLLKNLIKDDDLGKVVCMPTTDGDMHTLMTDYVQRDRLDRLQRKINVVWVGTFSGLKHLRKVLAAFEEFGGVLRNEGKELELCVVCDYPLEYNAFNFALKNIEWEREIAIDVMLKAHIGIMPLEDTTATRGKCGFKLIQYLSVGLPVVGSNIGMNKIILKENVGVGVDGLDCSMWLDAMKKIVKDDDTWIRYSLQAYKEWEKEYSFEANYRRWEGLLTI